MAQVNLKDIGYALILIFVLGLVLHMITPYMSEGFESGPPVCGVDTPCSGNLKCINGFCAKTERVPVIEKAPVDLLSPGSSAPYF
jgi:hypothetical protein